MTDKNMEETKKYNQKSGQPTGTNSIAESDQDAVKQAKARNAYLANTAASDIRNTAFGSNMGSAMSSSMGSANMNAQQVRAMHTPWESEVSGQGSFTNLKQDAKPVKKESDKSKQKKGK